MKSNRIASLVSAAAALAAAFSSIQMMAAPIGDTSNLLWYDQPAAKWEQALPVGNGWLTEETRTIMADAGGTYPNLFDAHPPFQIDGNFGAVAGITEMLLQSQEHYTDPKTSAENYVIDLLPALPTVWPTGSVKGLRARGGFDGDINWRDGKLMRATIHSDAGGIARLRYGSVTQVLPLAKGKMLDWNGK